MKIKAKCIFYPDGVDIRVKRSKLNLYSLNGYKVFGVEKITEVRREEFYEDSIYYYKYTIFCDKSEYRIKLNIIQNFKFLWVVGKNWFQKEDNVRYLINILFLIIGLYLTYKKL